VKDANQNMLAITSALGVGAQQHGLLGTIPQMKRLYVTGAQQRSPRPLLANDHNWYEYQKGLVLRVDVETGVVETCVEYVSRPDACAPGDPILFKAGTVEGDRLYVCTQTEVLVYALPEFKLVNYISLPCFNDVHHVRPTPEGNMLIANSGLEMVLEVRPDGEVLREWNVLGEDPWQAFSKDTDYRQGINLKPHRGHPNFVFYAGDEIWATRFEKKDVVCLTQPERRVHVGIERVHDGIYHQGRIYLTTVNGHLVVANPETLKIESVMDLNAAHPEQALLGWCRGLLIQGDKAWVGFSRIRPTKFREAVSWVRLGFSRVLPTHIACYDLNRSQCLAEINLEDHGLDAVFSIHHAN
jgi:hypothetical protein